MNDPVDSAHCDEAEPRLSNPREQFLALEKEFELRVRQRTHKLELREERLRELASSIKRNEQRERQRLARLLHDRVQQLLVAAKMRIETVSAELHSEHRAELQQAIEVLNDSIQATRDLSVQLTPPLLHDQGLPAALEWLTSRMARLYGQVIHGKFDKTATPEHEEDREVLFQAAQEFLLNAVKHSGTNRVDCRLKRTPDWICLEIGDQGRGFDSTRDVENGSFGLFQIRQRLDSIGGYLTIRSAPGRGTSITAAIPAGRTTEAEG